MEVKGGYKQTEVGIIPEDWNIEPLGKITTLMTNGFVGPVIRHYSKNDDGVLYIQGYNVEENSFNFHGIKYVTEEFHRAHLKSCLREGDLLTIQTGEIGLTAIVPDALAGSNCHALIISRFDKKYISPHYISYYLNSKPGRARLRLIETGTTMKHLNVGDMLHFTVPLPPTKVEQQAIAEVLSDAEALIQALEQLIAKKRQVKQGAMLELLTGKRRLPGFSSEWETRKLGEITEIVSGGTPSTRIDEYWNGNINWCIPTDITGTPGKYLSATEKRITELGLKNSSATLLPKGTLLLCSRATIGDVKIATDVICTNQGFKSLICSNQVHNEFLYYVLLTMKSKLIEKAIGSTFLEITKKEISLIEIKIPSVSEQTAIAEILSDMDAEIAALEAKLVKARQVKQGMMQELLTGRIRLI
jgi:type I restriction enzyme S subunit